MQEVESRNHGIQEPPRHQGRQEIQESNGLTPAFSCARARSASASAGTHAPANFEVDGRKAVLLGGILRRGMYTFKPINKLQRIGHCQGLSFG